MSNDTQEHQEMSRNIEKMAITDEYSSPRGVLSVPCSDSEQGSLISRDNSISSRSNSFNSDKTGDDKTEDDKTGDDKNNNSTALVSTLDAINAAVQIKNMFESIRKKSMKRLTSTGLLNYCDQSKKSLRWRFGWSQVSEDSFDCGWMAPKPSWRNFSYQELEAATKSFSPGKLVAGPYFSYLYG